LSSSAAALLGSLGNCMHVAAQSGLLLSERVSRATVNATIWKSGSRCVDKLLLIVLGMGCNHTILQGNCCWLGSYMHDVALYNMII
jgi:hypothetical protein